MPDCDAASLLIRLFGPFEVRLNGAPLPRPRTRKAHWLLALLTLRSGAEVERAWLAGMLWPDSPEPQAYVSLRNSLADLRGVLGPEIGRLRAPSLRTLSLDLSGAEVDMVAFDSAIARGDTASLQHAVGLYRGPLLEGCAEEWAFQERQAREQAYLTALERLAAHALSGGDPATAERHLRLAVAVDPLRESAQRALIQTLAAGGNYAASTLAYRELRLLLHRELNAEPDPETQALFQRLRAEARSRAQAPTPAPTTHPLAGDLQRLVVTRPHPTASPTLSPRVPTEGGGTPGTPPSVGTQAAAPSWEPPRTEQKGENRFVTVLFADMSHSVETMQDLHPEDAADLVDRLLRAMVEVLIRYEGRVDRFLGDGLLAVFGVPQAHEDDPERAIRAALEIREAAQRLGLDVSAGINTGEVYLGELGSEQHHEKTVIGRVVNLAARLQEAAEPGRILAGTTTHHHTRGAFEFTPRSLAVQGIPQPVTAFAVERFLLRPEKARGIEGLRAELIGRDDELARARQALAEVLQGQGRVASLIGEAGVGKSRLVAELKQTALVPTEGRPAPLWLEGRCLELGMNAGYWLFADLFRDYDHRCRGGAPWPPDEDDRTRGERLAGCLWELAARGDLTTERVEEMGPLLGQLLSLRFGNDWDDRLKHASPEQIKHQTFMAIRDFFVALSRRQPVILICEDLHWADSLSLDLISLLMEALTLAPLLLLCVYRPEREHKCWHLATIASRKCPERYTEISLRELTPPQSRRLVESLLAIANLPASVTELILAKAQGNPFFVEEVVRSLIASGMVYQEEEVWQAREGIETVAVPDSVQSVILSRVDRLGRELQGVLESASAIGRLFQRRLLEHMTQGTTELERALWELEDQALIYQERVVPEEEYSFKHVLTQETIYQHILRRRRAVLHREVAEAIEALYPERLEEFYAQLARHYSLSGCLPKAIEFLLKAGQRALRLYANQEAIHDFESALRCLEQLPAEQHDLQAERSAHEGLGDVLFRTGDHAGAEARFQMALNLTSKEDAREFAALTAKLADAVHWQGQPERAIDIARAGLAVMGEDVMNAEAVNLLEVITRSSWARDDQEAERRYANQLQAILPHVPYFDAIYMSYYALAWVEVRARHSEAAERWLQEMERVCGEHHNDIGLARCYHGLGDLWRDRGNHQLASDWFAKSLAYCERTGDAHLLLEGHLERAYSLIFLDGDPDEIDQHIQRGKSLAREMAGTRAVISESVLCGMLGHAYSVRGDVEKAISFYRQALESGAYPTPLGVLGRLERLYALQNRHAEFRAFCRHNRALVGPAGSALQYWHLTPGSARGDYSRLAWKDAFDTPSLRAEWQWIDPGGESSWELLPQEGVLVVRSPAASGASQAAATTSRLLRPVAGDFAAETVLIGAEEQESHTAGLLLWASDQDYLFFGKGEPAVYEVRLGVCRHGQRQTIGRGWLPGPDLYLRLERLGDRVTALCSNDGQQWQTCGEAPFSPAGELSIGFHVACPASRSAGSVARFKGFRLLIPERV
jgi:predicted ATPase/class 3 adenylate cyclase/DNA-binding SARP family transcriptional activator/regulation of enolase protein 1 (concanavalin A-like superfamily)